MRVTGLPREDLLRDNTGKEACGRGDRGFNDKYLSFQALYYQTDNEVN